MWKTSSHRTLKTQQDHALFASTLAVCCLILSSLTLFRFEREKEMKHGKPLGSVSLLADPCGGQLS